MKKLTGLLVLSICGQLSSPVLSLQLPQADSPPGLVIQKVKWDSFDALTRADNGPLDKGSSSNPNRLPLPTQGTATTLVRTQFFVYSMEVTNNGPKPIQALTWDFVFLDAGTGAELRHHLLANFKKVSIHDKKILRFTTRAAPPRVVSAGGLEKDLRSPFAVKARVKCLLYTDGSTWEQPHSADGCKSLLSWIELRKKSPAGREDPPVKN
jgi:hypothetical protein